MVSGAHLKPGEMAIRYVRAQGGTPEATVLTTDIRTSAVNAALANGMFAHADETDDFEPVTKAHPGCAVVPAALAMAEREGRSGAELLAAVTLGYDVCCRFLLALGPDRVRATSPQRRRHELDHRRGRRPPPRWPGSMRRACATRSRTPRSRSRASGAGCAMPSTSRRRSTSPAWAPATASPRRIMAQMGFTGVWDVLDGEHNVLRRCRRSRSRRKWLPELGSRFFVTETAIKSFSVGYPIQAPLDAFLTLRREHGLTVDNVERIVVRLPEDGARIVNNRAMPDVNCQHIIAVALVDGAVSFEDSHSYERMADPKVRRGEGARAARSATATLMDPAAPRSGRRGGDAPGRPDGQPLHAPCARHEGESDGYAERERKGAALDGAGARR